MTREEAKIYFEQCNSRIISVCKDENKYDYEKQEIISNCARRTYEANRLAIQALEQEPKTEMLDKIRAEIDGYCSDNRDRNDGLYIAMRIIDKYKAESEV